MDYAKEIVAFADWLETNHMDATAQALWMHLMVLWQKSGFPEWFEVANSTLESKIGVSDKPFNRHRNTLIQKGRIEYDGKPKKKGGKYRIVTFAQSVGNSPSVPPIGNQSVGDIPSHHPTDTPSDCPSDCPSDFFLQEGTEGKKEGRKDGLIDERARAESQAMKQIEPEWRATFGTNIKPNDFAIISEYLGKGMQATLILQALVDARDNEATSEKYVWRILGTWDRDSIRTISDYVRHQQERADGQSERKPKQGKGDKVVPLKQGDGDMWAGVKQQQAALAAKGF